MHQCAAPVGDHHATVYARGERFASRRSFRNQVRSRLLCRTARQGSHQEDGESQRDHATHVQEGSGGKVKHAISKNAIS